MGKRSTKPSTKTSKFGVGERANHDSSEFYARALYKGIIIDEKAEYIENAIPLGTIDKIHETSSTDMSEIPDNSVHLMVTSPPYNVGKDYDENLSLEKYLKLLSDVFRETYRVLVPGGRACINIANVGRKPYLPYHKFIIDTMLEAGFFMRGEIIWDKGSSSGQSTAWGSWLSASNPTLRDVHEYILIFSKIKLKLDGREKISTITNNQFLEYTKSVWNFNATSAKKIGHPAPFPEELPYRLIQLYTFKGDTVLDPFIGSGQSALAALSTDRHFIGYELNHEYAEKAKARIMQRALELSNIKSRRVKENLGLSGKKTKKSSKTRKKKNANKLLGLEKFEKNGTVTEVP